MSVYKMLITLVGGYGAWTDNNLYLCMTGLGVTPQTTTLKDEKRVDSNLPYTEIRLGGCEQVPLELPTPWYQVRPS